MVDGRQSEASAHEPVRASRDRLPHCKCLFVVVEEAEDVVFGEAIAAFQEVELDGEG